jgi:Ca2+-binding RTX toxin-like protein
LTFAQIEATATSSASSSAAGLVAKALSTNLAGLFPTLASSTAPVQIYDGTAFVGVGGATIPTGDATTGFNIASTTGNIFLSEAPSGTQVTINDQGYDLIVSGNTSALINVNHSGNIGSAGNIDTLVGGAGRDGLAVHSGNNLLLAGNGLDTLWAGTGNDTLYGGGHSQLNTGSGISAIYGVQGNFANASDTINASGSGNAIQVFQGNNYVYATGSGSDTIYTGAGNDDVDLSGDQSGARAFVYGAGGTGSTVPAGSSSTTVYAGAGSDNVQFFGGNNVAFGGTGSDSVYLGVGSDLFIGKTGVDKVFLDSLASGGGAATIIGGTNTTVLASVGDTIDTFASSHTISGGYTQVTLGTGQLLDVKGVTVVFAGGVVKTF